jgi:uncharacterized membrane protein
MKPDLFMFMIGMFMALIVSFMGLLLAYLKRNREGTDAEMESNKGGASHD